MFGNTCTYLDENQRAAFEVTVQDGVLIHKSGSDQGKRVNTSSLNSLHSNGAGTAIFVMSPEGNIYIGAHGDTPGEFHHSSFLSGQPVSSAGEMVVEDGRILDVSNNSGHYHPSQSLNDQLFTELENRGMTEPDVDDIARSGINDSGEVMTPKKQARFKQANNAKPGDQIPEDWMDF